MLNIFVNFIWIITIPIIFLASVIFSVKLKFLQLTKISKFKTCFSNKNLSNSAISPFQAFTMSLAGKIGVGSIAGMFIAIEIGGYGSIFWLWISCILFSILSYAEGCLAQIYKQKSKNSATTTSGAYHYIKKGLNLKKLSLFYALLIFVTYCFIFTSIQVKTIAISFNSSLNIPYIYTGLVIGFIIFVIIFSGSSGIAKTCEKLIPFMAISYVAIGLIIIILNIDIIPYIFNKIIEDALNFKAITPSIFTTILIGVRRGVFSTECGVGTSAILAGSVNSNNPSNQGFIQILSVYVTALIVCTITCFIILIANVKTGHLLNVENSLNYFFGTFGNFYLLLALSLFGISTIISAYYFGESVLSFIFKKNINSFIFKIILTLVCVISSVINNSTIWNLADLFIGILTIINCYCMILLVEDVVSVSR